MTCRKMLLLYVAMAALSAAGSDTMVIREAAEEQQQPEYPKVNRDSGYGSPHATPEGYGAPQPPPYGTAPQVPAYGVPPEPQREADANYNTGLETGYGGTGATYTPTGSQLADPALGLSAFLVPLMTILGLSLLFPSYVSVQSRKRRTAGKSGESSLLYTNGTHKL